MKIAYFDCFSGISGDMCLGALVDAGVDMAALMRTLRKLPLKGYELTKIKVKRAHCMSTKVDVILKTKQHTPHINRWGDVQRIIQSASLPPSVKERGLKIFRRLFEAEAKVHGGTVQKIHLHELGSVDCMVDIFGTIIGLDMLGIETVCSSPVNLGSGFVETESGILPVPAPATAEILKGVPVYSTAVPFELTTPTGAAIIRELSSQFSDIPGMEIEKIGSGAGLRNDAHWPNMVRLFIGDSASLSPQKREETASADESIVVIETNIDDMNPQIFEHVVGMLFKAGALDVFLTQVIMKKGRPGVLLTVLCEDNKMDDLITIIFTETTTTGLRYYVTKRKTLQREIKTVDTKSGKIRVKFARYGDTIVKSAPEYEDCRSIARKLRIPIREVMKKVR